jgi:hypothetical protein
MRYFKLNIEDLVVTRDYYNYILLREKIISKGKNKGTKTYDVLGYFSSIRDLLIRIIDCHSIEDPEPLMDCLARLDKRVDKIEELILDHTGGHNVCRN